MGYDAGVYPFILLFFFQEVPLSSLIAPKKCNGSNIGSIQYECGCVDTTNLLHDIQQPESLILVATEWLTSPCTMSVQICMSSHVNTVKNG